MSVVAIVHPTGFVGTEIRETLERRHDLWRELRLLSTHEDEIGILTEVAGSAVMVTKLEKGDLDGIDVAFFCGGIQETRALLADRPAAMTAVILSIDANPEDGVPVVSGINIDQARRSETLLCPHPAAVLLSHLVYPLRAYGPRRAVGTFLEPASTEGKQALDEVFEQTRAILSFSSDQPREIFSTQMAFNVIPGRRGEHVAGQVAALVGGEIEIYVQLLRCGVFHSFGASVHLTLTRDPGEEAVRKALAAHPGNDASPDPDLLGMIDAAGRDEVLIGPVEGVSGLPGTYRIWAVMDNLTCGAAVNALHILEAVSGAVMVN